jgi:hypothetical protein
MAYAAGPGAEGWLADHADGQLAGFPASSTSSFTNALESK